MADPPRWIFCCDWFVVSALAGGILLSTPLAEADRCAAAKVGLTALWNDTRRADLRAAFTATGLGHAAETFARSAEALDRYAEEWTRERVDVCEALKVEIQHFAECIQSGAEPITGGQAGLRVVRILESASLSMKQRGKLVHLAPAGRVMSYGAA